MFECNDPTRWEGTNMAGQTFYTHFDSIFKIIQTLG
jgi:hypothetical protein